MKQKRLIKKIRRLEARLQKGATKLAKLKQKLRAAEAAKLAKAKSKSSGRTGKARTVHRASEPVQTVQERLTAMTAPKPERTSRGRSFKTVKRKRQITDERRAQLSTAMKARRATKRAASASEPSSRDHITSLEESFLQ